MRAEEARGRMAGKSLGRRLRLWCRLQRRRRTPYEIVIWDWLNGTLTPAEILHYRGMLPYG